MGTWVTANGLVLKTLEQILTELADAQHADVDAGLNTEPDEPMGQINGTFASQLREAWEVLGEAYNAFNPDDTEGTPLEGVCAITGTTRRGATKGTVTVTCTFSQPTTLIAGSHFANVSGDVTNRWTPVETYVGDGTTDDVEFECEVTGPVPAYAGTLTAINTPVTGWTSVTNALDAVLGEVQDSDPTLRAQREAELRASGSATCDAMRSDLLDNEHIRQAQVLENTSDITDANGLPPHSCECIVDDGDTPSLTDDEIAQLIWDTKGAGVRTIGTESGTAEDSNGSQHTIYFSRPVAKNVYLELDIEVDNVLGYAGSDALKAAIVAMGLVKNLVGRDLILNTYVSVAMGFAGIIDVTAVRAGFTVSPVGTTNLVLGVRERAVLDTSRIVVNETLIAPP